MSEKGKILNVLQIFTRAIELHGTDKVKETIESLEKQQIAESERLLLDYIVTKCMDFYDVEPKEIFNTSVRKCATARSMSFVLLNQHTKLTQEEIGGLFGGTRQGVSRAVKMYNRERRGVSDTAGLNFIKSHEELNKKIIEFKKNLKTA